MKILVTGGTGFVGAALVRRLLEQHEVVCLVRKDSGHNAHERLHLVAQNLAEPLDERRLPGSIDAVIHLAQSREFRRFPDQAPDIFEVNVGSTARLLHYARKAGARRFVLASTGGVCGYQPRPIVETDPPNLFNYYVATKYAAEALAASYAEYVAPVTLRYFFVYGEGQRGMFMPSLIERVLKGQPVTVSGKTGVTMNPIHVSDAVEATTRALDVERAEIINVAGPDTVNIVELAQLIGKLAGREPVYAYEPEKGSLAMIAGIEKMKLKLGVVPKVSLTEGVGRLLHDLQTGAMAR